MGREQLYNARFWYHPTEIDDTGNAIRPLDLILGNSQRAVFDEVRIDEPIISSLDLIRTCLPSVLVLGQKSLNSVNLVYLIFVLVIKGALSELLILKAQRNCEATSAFHRDFVLRIRKQRGEEPNPGKGFLSKPSRH